MFKPTIASVTKNLTKTVANLESLSTSCNDKANICRELVEEGIRQEEEYRAEAAKADKIAANIANLLEVE